MVLESQRWTGLRGHLGQPPLHMALLLAQANVQDPCRGGRVSSPLPLTVPVSSAIEQSHPHPPTLLTSLLESWRPKVTSGTRLWSRPCSPAGLGRNMSLGTGAGAGEEGP